MATITKGVSVSAPPRRRRMEGNSWSAWLWVGPALLLIGVFFIYPMVGTIVTSLESTDTLGNVTGFVGGTYNRFGHYYAVREGDAHSWVEAYIDDIQHPGWMTFDPTPSAGAQPTQAINHGRGFLEEQPRAPLSKALQALAEHVRMVASDSVALRR